MCRIKLCEEFVREHERNGVSASAQHHPADYALGQLAPFFAQNNSKTFQGSEVAVLNHFRRHGGQRGGIKLQSGNARKAANHFLKHGQMVHRLVEYVRGKPWSQNFSHTIPEISREAISGAMRLNIRTDSDKTSGLLSIFFDSVNVHCIQPP